MKNLIVTTGEHHLKKVDEQGQNVPVLQVIAHPEFNRFGCMDLDITLLQLKDLAKYGKVGGWVIRVAAIIEKCFAVGPCCLLLPSLG